MPLDQPSKLELNTIRNFIDFAGLRVLEIGAGDGRLAFPFAREAAVWVALDPNVEDLKIATEVLHKVPLDTLKLVLGDGRQLAFPNQSFDVAFYTWSLC